MSDFSAILDHPLRNDIISKLFSGVNPKEVAQWLKIKFPEKEQSHLRLTQKILKEFSDSQYTQYYEQFLEDKSVVQNNMLDKPDIRMSAALANNKTYQERMQEIADKEINILNTVEGAIAAVNFRMEQLFDLIQSDTTDIGKADHAFFKAVELFVSSADKLQKMKVISNTNAVTDYNLNIQSMNEIVMIMQDCIRETLAEIDPGLTNIFMEKLNDRISKAGHQPVISQDERLRIANNVSGKILAVTDLPEE